MSLRREVARLRKAVPGAEVQAAEIQRLQRVLCKERVDKAALRRLLDETVGLYAGTRRLRDQQDRVVSLSDDVGRLWYALQRSEAMKDRLKVRLLRRAESARAKSPAAADAALRKALGRSRRRKAALGRLRKENARLRRTVQARRPPAAARTCSGCGKPYAAVGVEESALVEIEVRAYRRVIRRPRWRRSCACASSPAEVSAPPATRLFANTAYGASVWSRVLYERYACLRPLQRVGVWLGDQGLPVSSGTLADSVPRFMPLFEPVAGAILAHQHEAVLRHADETTWRVQALRGEGHSGRAWLWTAVGNDAVRFHIDASRSAEAAAKLFGELAPETVIVCDRYSAYKRLARRLGGTVVLAFCWAHMRRDFIRCAAARVRLTGWCETWLARIAAIYRLNEARLACYDPGIERQSAAFDAAQGALAAALDGLFAAAQRELASLPEHAREGKPLRSLVNHREGLSVFADRPRVPLDNNLAERLLRGPAIGRRLSFGSDSGIGARFTALMYSVVGTLMLNRIDVLRWLEAWLAACADNGGRPPDDTAAWLPWSMDAARRRELTAPT